MPIHEETFTTVDGSIEAHVITPEGVGAWPTVIFCFDAGGTRPAMTTMAGRISSWGQQGMTFESPDRTACFRAKRR